MASRSSKPIGTIADGKDPKLYLPVLEPVRTGFCQLLGSIYKTDGVLSPAAVLDYRHGDDDVDGRTAALPSPVLPTKPPRPYTNVSYPIARFRTSLSLSLSLDESPIASGAGRDRERTSSRYEPSRRRRTLSSGNIRTEEMETVRPAALDAPSIVNKNDTAFAKDVLKFARYSLADSAERMGSGMDYHIQMITSDDRPRVLKFLRRFFFRDEPLNQSISLIPEGEDSTCEELEEYCSASIKDGNLSLMAISTSGAIIGVLLNGKMEPFNEEEPDYITNCGNPKFKKILKLLRHVDSKVNRDGRFDGLNVLEFRIVSVDSSWRGQGVAKALMKKAEDVGKENGYHMLRMDCTSLFSGKLAERCGFESIYEMKFSDYLDDEGKPNFTPAPPHVSVVSYIKQL